MKLIRHYDFTKMTELNIDDWNVEVGDKWSNNELQHYTNSPENIYFDNGLVIKGTYDGTTYKSARINSKGKFSFKYGKIEFIAKVPVGQGTWPALWMMPEENVYGHWPKSGEIDIMEHVGRDLNNLFLCLHTEEYNHSKDTALHTEYYLHNATSHFHKYGLLWNKDEISYIIDDKLVVTYNIKDLQNQTHEGWPFDQLFYPIINLAIGGKFGGPVDNSIFPVEFVIKDLKVWQD